MNQCSNYNERWMGDISLSGLYGDKQYFNRSSSISSLVQSDIQSDIVEALNICENGPRGSSKGLFVDVVRALSQ